MIVNFLIALIDEANSIAKQKPKDPDFLELIVYIIMVTFYYCNIFFKSNSDETKTDEPWKT